MGSGQPRNHSCIQDPRGYVRANYYRSLVPRGFAPQFPRDQAGRFPDRGGEQPGDNRTLIEATDEQLDPMIRNPIYPEPDLGWQYGGRWADAMRTCSDEMDQKQGNSASSLDDNELRLALAMNLGLDSAEMVNKRALRRSNCLRHQEQI